MAEFAPSSSKPKMTQAQVRRYIKEMEEKRRLAQLELEKAKLTWELSSNKELEKIEKEFDDVF